MQRGRPGPRGSSPGQHDAARVTVDEALVDDFRATGKAVRPARPGIGRERRDIVEPARVDHVGTVVAGWTAACCRPALRAMPRNR